MNGFITKLRNFFFILKFVYQNQSKLRKFLIASGFSISFALLAIKLVKKLFTRQKKQIRHNEIVKKVNPNFTREIKYIAKIMFPKVFSKQTGLLALHSLTLICRTFLSIYVATLDGALVKNIVQKDFLSFGKSLAKWLLIALPAVSCNSLIKFLESKLTIELKSVLVKKSLNHYFKNRVYYKISLTESIQIDQNLTDDIENLVSLTVHLYSHLTKPMLDLSLMSYSLISLARSQNLNFLIPTSIGLSVMVLTGGLMRRISPKFGKMAGELAKRKGYLRFLYSRVQANSEEIAFYAGENVERNLIDKSYKSLESQIEDVDKQKLWYVIVEQFFLKYVWSAVGLSMISIPILISERDKNSIGYLEDDAAELSKRTETFTTSKYLLINTADAVERIMTSYKEITELSGYTKRVYEMFENFERIKPIDNHLAIEDGKGNVYESCDEININIQNISVITPNGDVIVPSLSLEIKPGMNLLITGPNGCGKSSLFRIISGLWDLKAGSISRPSINEMFYVPQRPYLTIGNLRDQIIYPNNLSDMRARGMSDSDLREILDIVNLQPVVEREGGLDAVADWKDVLSGGEKQRIGLSRLFYHKPKYAFLDECTSAVSIDVEGKIYMKAKNEYKITLLTIAHRATLWQYHNYILQFDGLGNWKLEELNSNLDKRLDLKKEKDSLEKLLLDSSVTKKRLNELCDILGESSIAL